MARRRDLQVALALSLALHLPLLFVRWSTPTTRAPVHEIIARLIVEHDEAPPPPPPPPLRTERRGVLRGPAASAPAAITAPGELTAPALPAPERTPGEAPRIDLDAAFATARKAARTHRESVVPNLAEAPVVEAPNPVGNAIRKSKKGDCRDMAAGLGLFAIPVLIYETATEKHCQW